MAFWPPMKILAAMMFATLTGSAQVAVIGNTGLPTNTAGHVPVYILGLAADHQGHVYTVHSWDEPHQDIMMWDAATGQKLYNTGQVIPEALLNAIAVEPDGSVAYVSGWTQETPGLVFRLYKVALGDSPAVINFTVAGRSVQLASGQPASKFSIKLKNNAIQVLNPNTGIVTCYDKTTGSAGKTQSGTLPSDTYVTTNGYLVSKQLIANGAGSRLIGQNWEQRCTEFAGCIYYSPTNPNLLISSGRNTYLRNGQSVQWLGCGVSDITKEPSTTGPCKVIDYAGTDFLYYPYGGQYLNIYRLHPQPKGGPVMDVVSKLVSPDLVLQSFGVSTDGTLWLSSLYRVSTGEFCAVWKLPLNSLDELGNPVYDWAGAVEMVTQGTLLSAFNQTDPRSITVMMANYSAADSLVYALLYIPSLGPDRGGAWMAGNVLAAFKPDGSLAWSSVLKACAVGMAMVPTGGLVLGQNLDDSGVFANGTIHRYSNTGTIIATIQPPPQFGGYTSFANLASGAFDQYGALNVELAPDGLLDIFAQDDYNARVFWYHMP